MRPLLPTVLIAVLALLAGHSAAEAQVFAPGSCPAERSVQDDGSFTPLPRGSLFCPLLADPKQPHSFASMLRGTSDRFPATNIGAVGIGNRFGLFRWGPAQLSLSGAVFTQFDLDTPSFDMINADYIVGLPLTVTSGEFSLRSRIYHQSSHLGDEFLINSSVERENLSFESLELLLSQSLGAVRLYGGGEFIFNRTPEDLQPLIGHAGLELRPGATLVQIAPLGGVRFVAAADLKSAEQQDWTPGWSVRAGFEGSRPRPVEIPITRWQLLVEFFDGPTPYGQFYRGDIAYWGAGLHFTM